MSDSSNLRSAFASAPVAPGLWKRMAVYICVAFFVHAGMCAPAFAATLAKSSTAAAAKPISPEDIRKNFRIKTVHGHEVVAIDDMLFPVDQYSVRAGLSGAPWPDGLLLYVFAASVTPQDQTNFLNACALWSAGAHVSCKQRTTEPVYFTVYSTVSASECVNQSIVGMQAGGYIDICNWDVPHVIAHEIGHAFGFIHEQSRPDRDAYVFINFPNVQFGEAHNFDIVPDAEVVGEYDYGSIMEYTPCAFSINPNCAVIPNDVNEPAEKKTITPVKCNSTEESVMGTALAPSQLDLEGMAQRYGPPTALAVFKKAREASCGSQILDVRDKARICDQNKENCGLVAGSVVYSQTEARTGNFCDDTFNTTPGGCGPDRVQTTATKETSVDSNSCGTPNIGGYGPNNRHYFTWNCSCAVYTVNASCRTSKNGVNDAALTLLSTSKSQLEVAIAAFVKIVESGISQGAIAANVNDTLSKDLTAVVKRPGATPTLNRATKTVGERVSAHNGGHGGVMTSQEVHRLLSQT
jgi:hypothetical protein